MGWLILALGAVEVASIAAVAIGAMDPGGLLPVSASVALGCSASIVWDSMRR